MTAPTTNSLVNTANGTWTPGSSAITAAAGDLCVITRMGQRTAGAMPAAPTYADTNGGAHTSGADAGFHEDNSSDSGTNVTKTIIWSKVLVAGDIAAGKLCALTILGTNMSGCRGGIVTATPPTGFSWSGTASERLRGTFANTATGSGSVSLALPPRPGLALWSGSWVTGTSLASLTEAWNHGTAIAPEFDDVATGNAVTQAGFLAMDTPAAWVSGGTYVASNVVTYGGDVWHCFSAVSGSATVPSSDATHWTNTHQVNTTPGNSAAHCIISVTYQVVSSFTTDDAPAATDAVVMDNQPTIVDSVDAADSGTILVAQPDVAAATDTVAMTTDRPGPRFFMFFGSN